MALAKDSLRKIIIEFLNYRMLKLILPKEIISIYLFELSLNIIVIQII